MAIIAPIVASVGLDPGSAPSTARDDSVGRAISGVGSALSQAADLAQAVADKELKRKRFAASKEQRRIDAELDMEVEKAKANMDPSGAGFVETVNGLVNERYGKFFKSLDPLLKEEFGPDLNARSAEWQAIAAKASAAQGQVWYQKGVDEVTDDAAAVVYANPKLLPDAIADVERTIGESGLYRIEAEASRKKARITLQRQVAERAIADGDMSILPLLGVASPDNADAAALIRSFEGFRSNAYGDTKTSSGEFDAWRAGYGSDTTTLADGTVQAVTQGTVVSIDDAERDLQRRITEFQRTIIGQVGVDAWSKLPATARAGLSSVAYNYGSLPRSVVDAVKGGDVNAIATAVSALDANPDRREREAAAILGGAVPSQEFADVPFEVRRQLYDRLAAAGKATIETATTNAPAAIMNTGAYSGSMPTAQQFVAAYGPTDGADRYRTFQASVEVARTAYQMRTMPAADIAAAVEAYRPTSSGTGAALEADQFTKVQAAAAATLKDRADDPATYTRQAFPEVGKAWDAVQELQVKADATPADRSTAYRSALATTMSAQRTLGMPKPVLLPEAMVTTAVASWKDVEASEDARVAQTLALLNGTDDADQQRAIWRQLVDAGIPEEAGGAVDAMTRGDQAAAQRLFRAALFDASDLPGKAPESIDRVKEAVSSSLMMPGQVGDLFYGLSDGDVSNQERAAADAKLLTNAVVLRLRSGEGLDAAVQAVGKDLFGDVVPVRGDNMSVLMDADTMKRVDTGTLQAGFQGLLPRVKDALAASSAVSADLPAADGTKAILTAAEANQRDAILSEGYFRNAGDGFVFIDPFGGVAVEGPDGKPLMFTLDDVLAAANVARTAVKADPVADYVRQRALALSGAPGSVPAVE